MDLACKTIWDAIYNNLGRGGTFQVRNRLKLHILWLQSLEVKGNGSIFYKLFE
jgi:hypothetical protein